MTPRLRAVAADEAAPPPRPPANLKEAVERSELELLVAMRRRIATEVDLGVPSHALASLMKQMRDLDRDIRALALALANEEDDESGPIADEPWDESLI